MEENELDITEKLNWKRIIIPIILGLGAASYLLISSLNQSTFIKTDQIGTHTWVDQNGNGTIEYDDPSEFAMDANGEYLEVTATEILANQDWGWYALISLSLALFMVVLRDFGYMVRIRFLTDKQLNWKQSFRVIMLWEFASALTPSVVGGSGVAIFILNREGINLGKSTALVFITALLDEIFYIIMVPIIFMIIGSEALFPEAWGDGVVGSESVKILFYFGYGFIILLTSILLLSVFFFPEKFKRLLMNIFSMRFLKRFLRRVIRLGDEVVMASQELKGKKAQYWVNSFSATFLSWTARFFTLNFILMAFIPQFNHLQVYGKQLVMWVIMLISPTPGSSGVAEIALSSFFEYLVPSGILIAAIAVIWRLLTYFPYLFIGAFILPRWLRKTSSN